MGDTINMNTIDTSKRPKWVWAIAIFYVFSIIFTSYSFYAVYKGLIPLNEAQQKYFSNLGIIDYAITVISALLSIAAATTFFMLKKITIKIWAASFIFGIITQIYSALGSNYLEVMKASDNIGALIGITITIAIYFYAKRLNARGYLK